MGFISDLLDTVSASLSLGRGGPKVTASSGKIRTEDSGGTLTQHQAAAGVADDDVATIAQLNAVEIGIRRIGNVKVLADSNQTLSGVPSGVDGTPVSADDRVLLTAQSTASENGPWVIKAGSWERPTDYDTGDAAAGITTHVEQGTTYGDQVWQCTSDSGSDVIDTNNTTWGSIGSGGSSKEKWSTYHNFNQTSLAENYIPINDLAEATGDDYYHRLITRNVASKILRVVVWPAAIACGDTVIRCYEYDRPQSSAIATLLKTSATIDMNSSSAFVFDFTGDPPLYAANELGGISIDTTDDGPDQCCIRIDWEEQ